MAPRRRNQPPAPGVNPLFQDVAEVDWCMNFKPKNMLRGHREVFKWLKKKLEGMKEEAGTFVVKTEEEGREDNTFHLLPQKIGSFFKVNLKVSRGSKPLPLLFSLHNLYLLGFQHANIWHFFNDADLSGSGLDLESNKRYWMSLCISGGYHGNMFNHVKIGIAEIHNIYHVLTRYDEFMAQGKSDEVDSALFRAIVVLPEAWRFPRWRACLYRIFMYNTRFVDREPPQEDDQYEVLFKKWKKISKRVIAGSHEFCTFQALVGYETYDKLLPAVSILIRTERSVSS